MGCRVSVLGTFVEIAREGLCPMSRLNLETFYKINQLLSQIPEKIQRDRSVKGVPMEYPLIVRVPN